MTKTTGDDFLRKHGIEVPEPSSLAVIHAEPVSLIPRVTYIFSDLAKEMLEPLIEGRGQTVDQLLAQLAKDKKAPGYSIIFFFDQSYFMAPHILTVRLSVEEIAMLCYHEKPPHSLEAPPPVGALGVADIPTLTHLSTRSPFLGQLLPIADGPKDDSIWVYFLGPGKTMKIVAKEAVDIPIKTREPVTVE